jgi:hypothetical protein
MYDLGPVWIASTNCPTKYLALTVDVGVRLDGSPDSEPFQLFGHAFSFLRPQLARSRAAKSLTKILVRPRFGRAAGGAIQTAP